MPRAAIIHASPDIIEAPKSSGEMKRRGGTHKKVSFILSFSPNPKDNIPDPGVQAPILKYHIQRKESKMWEMMILKYSKKISYTYTFPTAVWSRCETV